VVTEGVQLNTKWQSRKFLATIGFGLLFTGLLLHGDLSGDEYVRLMSIVLSAFVFAQAWVDKRTTKKPTRTDAEIFGEDY